METVQAINIYKYKRGKPKSNLGELKIERIGKLKKIIINPKIKTKKEALFSLGAFFFKFIGVLS